MSDKSVQMICGVALLAAGADFDAGLLAGIGAILLLTTVI